MSGENLDDLVAFAGPVRLARGEPCEVAVAAWAEGQRDANVTLTVFDALTGRVVDLDLRGSRDDVATRYRPTAVKQRGRPKLGVTPREVTLLPRHWDWLATQPGGASATLRRLVEQAKKAGEAAGDTKPRREATYRFMSSMAGDLPGFEEASRALFAGDKDELAKRMAAWPPDISTQVLAYLAPAGAEA